MPKSNSPPKPHSKATNDDGVILYLTPRQQLRLAIKGEAVTIRAWSDVTGIGVWLATKEGVTIPLDALDAAIDALKKIAATAKRRAA